MCQEGCSLTKPFVVTPSYANSTLCLVLIRSLVLQRCTCITPFYANSTLCLESTHAFLINGQLQLGRLALPVLYTFCKQPGVRITAFLYLQWATQTGQMIDCSAGGWIFPPLVLQEPSTINSDPCVSCEFVNMLRTELKISRCSKKVVSSIGHYQRMEDWIHIFLDPCDNSI